MLKNENSSKPVKPRPCSKPETETETIKETGTIGKVGQLAMNSAKTNPMYLNRSIERPRDLSFSSAFNGQSGSKMPGSGTVTLHLSITKE